VIARALAACLIVLAALADASGAHSAAFYLLLAAIPLAGVAALVALGELIDAAGPEDRVLGGVQVLLSFLIVLFALVAAASSSQALVDGNVGGTGVSALVVCLGLFALQAVVAVVGDALKSSLEIDFGPGERSPGR
jgi:hypothetical protein